MTAYQHRVHNGIAEQEPVLCLACGSTGAVTYDPDRNPGWSVACPNRAGVAERRYNRDGKCENTRQRFRTTRAGAIAAWNRSQNPAPRRLYVEKEDLSKAEPNCPRCGLRGEHICLSAHGFQRKADHGDASARFRTGG